MRAVVLCSLLLCSTFVHAQDAAAADEHLLQGAAAFQAAQYDKALVEFKVARTLGADDDALWYIAATLVNLQRYLEALDTFLRAQAKSPRGRDALLDYYEAVASYETRLYHRADALLLRVGKQAGPRVAGQAQKLKALLAPVLAVNPTETNIDWYIDRGRTLLNEKRQALARLFFEEAQRLGQRHPQCHRCEETKRLAEQGAAP